MSDPDLPRLVVLLSGRGSNFVALHEATASGRLPARIAAVISDREDAAGLERASALGIDTACLERSRFDSRAEFERHLTVAIAGYAPSYIVLAGFMRVLGEQFVLDHLGRMVNIHPSLLPRHRGLDTHQRVLDAGEREHGASVHFVTPALDAGPVLARVEIDVAGDETAESLARRLLPLEHQLYPAALALLLNHRVELRNEDITIDDQPLSRPLVLGRDLDLDGRRLR